MNQINNLWFRIGFGIAVLIVLVLNFASYNSAFNRYSKWQSDGIRFSGEGFAWGFPLKMYMPNYGFDVLPLIINVILAALCAGAVGIVFEVLAGNLRDRSNKDTA